MASLKLFWNFIKALMVSIWGLTMMDLLAVFNFDFLQGFDGIIKTIMALAGAVYFIITIPHKLKMQKLERDTKRLNNEMLAEEVEQKCIETEIEKKIPIKVLRFKPQ